MTDNSSSLDPNVIFGELFSRLHLIQTSRFNYLGTYHPPHQMHLINQNVFKLDPSIALSFLMESIARVEDIQTNMDNILMVLEVKEEQPPIGKEWFEKTSQEEVKARVKSNLESELTAYLKELTSAKDTVEKSPDDLEQGDPKKRKIRLKGSMEQFGALIRLL